MDRVTGKNYLSQSEISYCASIILNGEKHAVSKIQYDPDGMMKLDFAPYAVTATLKIKSDNDAIFWEVSEGQVLRNLLFFWRYH